MRNYLMHHGVKGQKWGVRRYQNEDGSRTKAGKLRRKKRAVFISGSSKTETRDSPYYREDLPDEVKRVLDKCMDEKVKVIIGDAPGIDRQVQRYLNDAGYKKVHVYGPGKKVRYSANSKWKKHPIDDPDHEPGSKEWLAKKDIAMERAATEGLAVILDEGSSATRKNIERLSSNGKSTMVYQLNRDGKDLGIKTWRNTDDRHYFRIDT